MYEGIVFVRNCLTPNGKSLATANWQLETGKPALLLNQYFRPIDAPFGFGQIAQWVRIPAIGSSSEKEDQPKKTKT